MGNVAIGVIAVLVTIVLVAALWHAGVRRVVVAAIGAGLTLAVMFAALYFYVVGGDTPQSLALLVAVAFPVMFFLSLGVGIPFNRRRNPPDTFDDRNRQVPLGLPRTFHGWMQRPWTVTDVAGLIIAGVIMLLIRSWWNH